MLNCLQREAKETLEGLQQDSRYRARIQTVNEFGKSKWSEEYEFHTFGGFKGLWNLVLILTLMF